MIKKLKTYEPALKAKVALEAHKKEKTILEICSEYNLPKSNILDWQNKLLNSAEQIFIGDSEKDKQLKKLKAEIESLHKVIGEISVENNFFKKSYLFKQG